MIRSYSTVKIAVFWVDFLNILHSQSNDRNMYISLYNINIFTIRSLHHVY